MTAYKFLAAGRTGRFSDVVWPAPRESDPGVWVESHGPLAACLDGVHACRFEQLLDWIDDELWELELDGEVREESGLLVAERGRLLRRVDFWDAAAARAFTEAVRARASVAAGFGDDLGALALGWRPGMGFPPGTSPPGGPTPGAIAANVSFVSAHAAGVAAADYEAAFAAERAWQLAWLADRLELSV